MQVGQYLVMTVKWCAAPELWDQNCPQRTHAVASIPPVGCSRRLMYGLFIGVFLVAGDAGAFGEVAYFPCGGEESSGQLPCVLRGQLDVQATEVDGDMICVGCSAGDDGEEFPETHSEGEVSVDAQ